MLLRKSKIFSIAVCIIIVLSVLFSMIPCTADAQSNDKSLTLVCVSSDTVLAGMKWKLYKVGKRISGKGNFVQTGEFSGFQMNFSRLTSERLEKAAQTFQSYAIANKIAPIREGQTNENGEVEFTGLDAGLYLVSGKLLKIGTYYYVPTTAFIEIKEDDTNLRYNAYPKFEYQVANAQPRNYTVEKVWVNDENHLSERPVEITVDLYKDEEYYDTVILNADNKWRKRWTDLDGTSSWIAIEREVPAHYEMRIEYSYDSARYFIENAYVEEENTGTTVSTTTTGTVDNVEDTRTRTTTTTATVGNVEDTRTKTTTGTVDNVEDTRTRTTATTATVGNVEDTRTRTTTGTNFNGSETGTMIEGPVSSTTTASVNNETATRTGTDVSTTNTDDNSSATRTRTTVSTTKNNNNKVTTTRRPNNNSSDSNSSSKLPQTGQLWWPVVPLSIGGVLLVSAGLAIKARKKEE